MRPNREDYIMGNKNERGATMVEASLTMFLFMFTILMIIEISLKAFTIFSLQHHLNDLGRESIISEELVSGEDKYTTINSRLINRLNSFGIDSNTLQLNICTDVQTNCTSNSNGLSNDYFFLVATITSPSIIGIQIPLTARTLTKNEAY